jgi:hypothetical protein
MVWYNLLSDALRTLGFKHVSADSSFWVRDVTHMSLIYLTSVVDDMLVTSACTKLTLIP